jgi:hypothetical protein
MTTSTDTDASVAESTTHDAPPLKALRSIWCAKTEKGVQTPSAPHRPAVSWL